MTYFWVGYLSFVLTTKSLSAYPWHLMSTVWKAGEGFDPMWKTRDWTETRSRAIITVAKPGTFSPPHIPLNSRPIKWISIEVKDSTAPVWYRDSVALSLRTVCGSSWMAHVLHSCRHLDEFIVPWREKESVNPGGQSHVLTWWTWCAVQ